MHLSKKEIEQIIEDEITVDCYGDHEVLMGWAIFLTDNIEYPFKAKCELEYADGKKKWKKVKIVKNLTGEDDFNGRTFYVQADVDGLLIPTLLSNLINIKASEDTLRTIAVWKYKLGY